MQKLGGNSKTPPAAIAFIVRLSEFLRELYGRKEDKKSCNIGGGFRIFADNIIYYIP